MVLLCQCHYDCRSPNYIIVEAKIFSGGNSSLVLVDYLRKILSPHSPQLPIQHSWQPQTTDILQRIAYLPSPCHPRYESSRRSLGHPALPPPNPSCTRPSLGFRRPPSCTFLASRPKCHDVSFKRKGLRKLSPSDGGKHMGRADAGSQSFIYTPYPPPPPAGTGH